MSHAHSSCISNMKNIKVNMLPKKESVVKTELSLEVKRAMLMMFSIDLGKYKTEHLLKCFLQFACTNWDGSQKEGVTF